MVRSWMGDQDEVGSILLAPPARVSERMPDEVDRPMPEAFPLKHQYFALFSIDPYERAWREKIHHAVVFRPDPAKSEAVLLP